MTRHLFCALAGASALAFPAMAQEAAADPAMEARKLQAEVVTAEANARKAGADADAAEVKAETDAANALLARIPASDAKEKAVLGDGAGKAEAAILSSAAMQNAAFSIARAVTEEKKQVVIVPSSTDPSLVKWQLYQLRRDAIKAALTSANTDFDSLDPTDAQPGQMGSFVDPLSGVVALGQAMGVAAKIGSYFQSEHQIRGYDITPSEAFLQAAVAEQLTAADWPVQVLTRLGSRDVVSVFGGDLQTMDALAAQASAKFAAASAEAKSLRAKAAKPGNEANADNLIAKAKPYENVAARLGYALEAYKAFLTDLSSTDSKSAIPLGDVILERKLEDALKDGAAMLVVKPFSQSGSFYSKTNLWTLLGTEMPFRVSGSAVASYTLADRDDNLLAAGVFGEQTPYIHVNKQEQYPAKKTWGPSEAPKAPTRPVTAEAAVNGTAD